MSPATDACATGDFLLYDLPTERIAASKENAMQGRMLFRRGMGVLAAIVMLAAPAYAQTRGMEHRDDRRDDRGAGRDAKQDCKAGDEKSRPECRQEKRDTKHGGGEAAPAGQAPATPPPQ